MKSYKIWVRSLPKDTVISIFEKMREDGVKWRSGDTPGAHDYSSWLNALFVRDGVMTRDTRSGERGDYFDDWDVGDEITAAEYLYGNRELDFSEDEFLHLLGVGDSDG